jgi:osmotically-inducible protein OsmY
MKKILLILILAAGVYWAWRHWNGVKNAAVTAEILGRTAKTYPLALFTIKVRSSDKEIQLMGKANQEEETKIFSIVNKVKGVRTVNNEIQVTHTLRTPVQVFRDFKITSLVFERLVAEEGIAGLKLRVQTYDGTVVLNGKVSHQEQSLLATHLAREVAGVKKVINEIQINK